MARLTISIDMARELHPMDPDADRFAGTLRDMNGNTCGEYAVEGE